MDCYKPSNLEDTAPGNIKSTYISLGIIKFKGRNTTLMCYVKNVVKLCSTAKVFSGFTTIVCGYTGMSPTNPTKIMKETTYQILISQKL